MSCTQAFSKESAVFAACRLLQCNEVVAKVRKMQMFAGNMAALKKSVGKREGDCMTQLIS